MDILKTIKDRANNSPYYKLLGLKVKKLKRGKAEVELPFKSNLTNFLGTAHGGCIASLVDSAGGLAVATTMEDENIKCATVDLKVNFLLPFTEGKLQGKGKVIHRGRTISVAEVDIRGEGNVLVAKGIVTIFHQGNK